MNELGPTMASLSESDKIRPGPVYQRYLMRKHHMPLDPPTEVEKRAAIRILRDPWEDEVSLEAFRIFEEASRE